VLKSSRVAKTDPSRVGRSSRLQNSEVTSADTTRLSRLLTTKIKNCSGEFSTISGKTKLAVFQQLTAAVQSWILSLYIKASSNLDEFDDEDSAADMVAMVTQYLSVNEKALEGERSDPSCAGKTVDSLI